MGGSQARWVFAVAVLVSGLLYWWFADWWAYVEFPEGPMPKFVMPWWWQAIESAMIGVLAGSLLTGAWWLAWWSWSGRTRHCTRHSWCR